MDILLGFVVITGSLILQTAVFSRLPLLNGTADLVMLVVIAWGLNDRVKAHWEWALLAGLFVSFASAMPIVTPLLGYLFVMAFVRLLHSRVWQVPVLAMILAGFTCTIAYLMYTMITLQLIKGTTLDWTAGLYRVILPSALWNVFLSIPVYTLVKDMSNWVYRVEEAE